MTGKRSRHLASQDFAASAFYWLYNIFKWALASSENCRGKMLMIGSGVKKKMCTRGCTIRTLMMMFDEVHYEPDVVKIVSTGALAEMQ